jgi:hypothetical protein
VNAGTVPAASPDEALAVGFAGVGESTAAESEGAAVADGSGVTGEAVWPPI